MCKYFSFLLLFICFGLSSCRTIDELRDDNNIIELKTDPLIGTWKEQEKYCIEHLYETYNSDGSFTVEQINFRTQEMINYGSGTWVNVTSDFNSKDRYYSFSFNEPYSNLSWYTKTNSLTISFSTQFDIFNSRRKVKTGTDCQTSFSSTTRLVFFKIVN